MDLMHFDHCKICEEMWITDAVYVDGMCRRCNYDAGSMFKGSTAAARVARVMKFSHENSMIPREVPPCLLALTPLEERCISITVPSINIYYKVPPYSTYTRDSRVPNNYV